MSRKGVLGKDQNISKYLVKLKEIVISPKHKTTEQLHNQILAFAKPSLNNPFLGNITKYCFSYSKVQELSKLRETYLHRVQNAMKSISVADSIIKDLAVKKIPKKGSVFFHGNNSILAEIIKSAKKEKNFDVLLLSSNTGLISQLKKHKINFHVFPDTAARIAVKSADLVMLGCHAITPNKVFNAVGSELAAEIAHKHNVPVYVCSPAMFFTQSYVLPPHTPVKKGNFVYHDYNFEQINPGLLTGIISEIGIYDHKSFIDHLETEMPWIFTSSFS